MVFLHGLFLKIDRGPFPACCKRKQSGTGPSRRHIQGTKIAKRLPSVKCSLLQYSKIENFSKKIFSKKLHTQKNGPSGGKQETPFWFSSLAQIVQFGAIIFCRTFKNYFGQFVWIEKKGHYNSRVSLHEAPTKNVTA